MVRLTGEVAGRLHELEAVIERGLQTFVEVGSAIREIRDSRLYRERYATFEDYCRERWGWGRNYANKQVVAADTAALVGTNVPIANEAQARALAPLAREDPEAARAVWEEEAREAEREGRRPTAAALSERAEAARLRGGEERPAEPVLPTPGTTDHERRAAAAARKGQRLAQRAEYALRTGNTELPADPQISPAAWEYALWEAVSLRGHNIPNVVDALGHNLDILLSRAPPEAVGRYLAEPTNHEEAEHHERLIEELHEGVAWIGRVIEEAELARGPGSANEPRRPVWIGPTEDHGRDYVGKSGEIVGKSFEAYGFGPGRKWRWTVRLDDGEQIEVRPWEIRFL